MRDEHLDLKTSPPPELARVTASIVAEIQRRLVNRATPFLVALDGASGSGKSTLALSISS